VAWRHVHTPWREIYFLCDMGNRFCLCLHPRAYLCRCCCHPALDSQLQSTPAEINSYTSDSPIPTELQGVEMASVCAWFRQPVSPWQHPAVVCVCLSSLHLADGTRTCQPPLVTQQRPPTSGFLYASCLS